MYFRLRILFFYFWGLHPVASITTDFLRVPSIATHTFWMYYILFLLHTYIHTYIQKVSVAIDGTLKCQYEYYNCLFSVSNVIHSIQFQIIGQKTAVEIRNWRSRSLSASEEWRQVQSSATLLCLNRGPRDGAWRGWGDIVGTGRRDVREWPTSSPDLVAPLATVHSPPYPRSSQYL
jgi:hypothetical protein